MNMILGIDGGGTRTTAWLADERGRVVGKAVAGPSNPLKVGFEACEREILRAANAAVAAVYDRRTEKAVAVAAGLSRHSRRSKIGGVKPRIQAVVVGLAGVDRPPVHARLATWLRTAIPAHHHLLTSDAAIAMHAAIGNSPGIILISGTGSIAYAQDERGRVYRCGGWGVPFDDVGSGYDLGRKAIVAALRDFDGRGERTTMGRKICRALSLHDITQIVLKPLTPQDIAGLFPLVQEAAHRGDRVARDILDDAARDLGALAFALANRLGWKRRRFTIVCAGGVFTASARIRAKFSRMVRKTNPRAHVTLFRKQPVEGALAMARELGMDGVDSFRGSEA